MLVDIKMKKIKDIIQNHKKIIGIWGYPDPQILVQIQSKFPNVEIIDLDVDLNAPEANILPDAYCKIIKNIINNAMALKNNLEIIIASVGEEKCDSGRFAAKILENLGFNIIQTKYNDISPKKTSLPISTSDLPLKKKVLTIMDNIVEKQPLEIQTIKPEYGFWGVPPNDLSVLELFPDTTHVYGWIRCVEAQIPASLDLEMFVDESIPTVFYAQTFCAKMQLARYLAKKHDGLYVDVDDIASNSVKAKIEAFIKLG